MVSRVLHIVSMTALGLAVLAGIALVVVFAASVAVVGAAALALMALAGAAMPSMSASIASASPRLVMRRCSVARFSLSPFFTGRGSG